MFKILFVNIPEITMIIITSIILISGFNINKIKLVDIIKTIFSVILIAISLFYLRNCLTDIPLITLCSTIIYFLTLKYIYKFNIRQSLVASVLSMMFIVILEIMCSPIIEFMINNWLVPNNLSDQLILLSITILLRGIHLVLIIILAKLNINFNNTKILKDTWDSLDKYKKVNIIIMISLLFFSMFIATFYTQIFIKYNNASNMQIFYISTLFILVLSIVLLNRTMNYEKHKEFINLDPEIIIERIINSSDNNQLKIYKNMIQRKFNIIKLKKVEDLFKSYNLINNLFEYKIDKSLENIQYDYTNYIYIIDGVLKEIMKYTSKINYELKKGTKGIDTSIYIDKIKKNELKNIEKSFNSRLLNTDEKIVFDIEDNPIRIIININILFKGGDTNE